MSNTLKSWTDTDRFQRLLAEELIPEALRMVLDCVIKRAG